MPLQYINSCLNKWFNFPTNKIYCQVATLDDKKPHIRTMELYQITSEGNIVLLTETSTKKWSDLNNCPNIAICILNAQYGQILAEGDTTLITSSTNLSTAKFYWDNCLDQYWRNFYILRNKKSKNFYEEGIPLSFGIILLKPNFWEILEINQNDFLKSSRKHYHQKQSSWSMSNVEPV